jgi:carbamate kinase
MRILVALGGNALLRRSEPMTAEAQRANVRIAAEALAAIHPGNELIITHGNGPQVGLLALQGVAYDSSQLYPLDVLGAETEGMIGYMIEQELGNLLPVEVPFATVLTMIRADRRCTSQHHIGIADRLNLLRPRASTRASKRLNSTLRTLTTAGSRSRA